MAPTNGTQSPMAPSSIQQWHPTNGTRKKRIRRLHDKYFAHPCLHARLITTSCSVPTLQVTCQCSGSIFCVPCCMFRSCSHVHILCTCDARALRHHVSIRLEQVPGVQLASLQTFQIRNSIAQLLTFTRPNFRTLSALSHVSKPFFLGFRKASSFVQVMSHVSHVHLLQDFCIFVYSVHLFSFIFTYICSSTCRRKLSLKLSGRTFQHLRL